MNQIFSGPWAQACAEALRNRPAYREAAAAWEGAILLVMAPEPGEGVAGERCVLLDLWHGDCRSARAALPDEESLARYVLVGSPAAWNQVLSGTVAPLMAVMLGRLRLTKGDLTELLPYVGAARELVAAAASVPTVFPDHAG